MNAGAFGENFPYTNFHDLNLDWIIKEFKEGKISLQEALDAFNTGMEHVDTVADQVEATADRAEQSATNASASATNASASATRAEEAAQEALQASSKRRYLIIGDSYTQGYTPEGLIEAWPTKLRRVMNISPDDIYTVAVGGSGFWVNITTDSRYIPNMVQTGYDMITTPDTITDIIFAFGYNDLNAWDNPSRMQSIAETTLTLIRTLFPQNPRIWLFGVGYTTNHFNQYKMQSVYRIYGSFSGYGFQKLTDYITDINMFASDGIHMSPTGQTRISQIISQMLNNGSNVNGEFRNFTMDTDYFFKNIINNINMNGPVYMYRQDDRLIITCPTSSYLATLFNAEDGISLSRTPTKVGKYINNVITGFHNWTKIGQMFPCDIIYQSQGVAGYHHTNGYINIAPDTDDDNELYIWVSVFNTNAESTNYFVINNITRLQISGFSMEFKHLG